MVMNPLKPRQNGFQFAGDIFKCIFPNAKGPIYNKSELVQIMVWRRIGDKPLSEPIMA